MRAEGWGRGIRGLQFSGQPGRGVARRVEVGLSLHGERPREQLVVVFVLFLLFLALPILSFLFSILLLSRLPRARAPSTVFAHALHREGAGALFITRGGPAEALFLRWVATTSGRRRVLAASCAC